MAEEQKTRKDNSFFLSDIQCIPGGDKDLPPEYHAYRKKWNEVNEKLTVTDFPMHIDVELNMTCNYACVMCPRTAMNIKNQGQVMEPELYKKIIDEGKREGLLSVDFGDLGEALLRPDLVELIKYATDAGIPDRILHTNASLLTEETSQRLLDAGITKFTVSLDAFSKESYEKIRIGGDYDKVVANVLKFLELKKKRGLSYPIVRLSFIRMSLNEHEVEPFVNFWKDKVNHIAIQEYINPGKLQDNSLKSSSSEFKEKPKKFVCTQLFQRLVIRWDGTIMPCCVDYENALALGNAHTMTLKEAWRSKKLQALRDIHLAGKFETIPACKLCIESKL